MELKICDEDEEKIKKYRIDGKRLVWHKFHFTIDIHTHEVIAAEFNASNVTKGEVLPNLLKQTHQGINGISNNSAYGVRQCNDIVRIKRMALPIPPKVEIIFGKRSHPHNLTASYQR